MSATAIDTELAAMEAADEAKKKDFEARIREAEAAMIEEYTLKTIPEEYDPRLSSQPILPAAELASKEVDEELKQKGNISNSANSGNVAVHNTTASNPNALS